MNNTVADMCRSSTDVLLSVFCCESNADGHMALFSLNLLLFTYLLATLLLILNIWSYIRRWNRCLLWNAENHAQNWSQLCDTRVQCHSILPGVMNQPGVLYHPVSSTSCCNLKPFIVKDLFQPYHNYCSWLPALLANKSVLQFFRSSSGSRVHR